MISLDVALWKRSICCPQCRFYFFSSRQTVTTRTRVAPTHNFAKSSSIVWVGGRRVNFFCRPKDIRELVVTLHSIIIRSFTPQLSWYLEALVRNFLALVLEPFRRWNPGAGINPAGITPVPVRAKFRIAEDDVSIEEPESRK